MPREIKGITALAKAFPSEWLLYVSLNCYPRHQDPMEIDAVVVMDDMVLLLEIKDWNGQLTSRQDRWFIGGQSRGRSAVTASEEKAKKLKTVISNESRLAGSFYIEARVVLTGTANRSALPHHEAARTLTLAEVCSIADPLKRQNFLRKGKISLTKAYALESEFDRIFNNTLLFQHSEANWAGFTVTQKDVFLHPRSVWSDHLAERRDEQRIKAMVRTWSFDRLPVGLNSMATRKLVALRETQAFAYLQDIGSELIARNRVLRDIGPSEDEIATNHFEVRSIGTGWSTLDRYLEKHRDDLTWQDRVVIASSLLNTVAELHNQNVTHRDIGPKAVWVGSPSELALTGFMSCQLPDKNSVMDWLTDLQGYAPPLPEGATVKTTGRQRDVYTCAYLVAMILADVRNGDVEAAIAGLPAELTPLHEWLRRGLAADPKQRFLDATELVHEFSEVVEDRRPDGFAPALLDRFETETVPFLTWPNAGKSIGHGIKQLYPSERDGKTVMVKVWMGVSRSRSLDTDCALLRLMVGAERLSGSPVQGLPTFVESGLSPVGAYIAYERCPGAPLETITALPQGTSIPLVLQLLLAVAALHGLGCDHGDISLTNVLLDLEANSLFLIDPFDLSPFGDGSVRTPAMCPPNWESLSQFSLDRYATLRVACKLLELDSSVAAIELLQELKLELDKPIVESLERATAIVTAAVHVATAPLVTNFQVQTNLETFGFERGDQLFVRRPKDEHGRVIFRLTTENGQLTLTGDSVRLLGLYFRKTQFTSLAFESRAGLDDLPLKLTLTRGSERGFDELYRFLSEHERFAQPPGGDSADDHIQIPAFDVARYWKRLVELEQDARVEIAVGEILSNRDGVLICCYENLGKDFDFDDEDFIEVHAGSKRIGQVDLASSSFPAAIGLRCDHGRVSVGDRLRLAGRREQSSMDRRARAVRRILDSRSVIPELIEYFDPEGAIPPKNYDLKIEEIDLKGYMLNEGQEVAFRHLLSSGPVGLLQGPPGTGKTRFIASFVHWLITKAGCQRILIASQSHEAVNNAVDSLLLLHKRRGDRPSLLRIGSKGITERIRPFHSMELRERYRVKFEAAAKFRFGQLAAALGVPRAYASDLFDLDRQVGSLARRCASVQISLKGEGDQLAVDRERNRVQQSRVEDAFDTAFRSYSGHSPDLSKPMDEYQRLQQELAAKHSDVSPGDISSCGKALQLTQDWLSSLGSPGRNFEEFLAKTRSVVAATCVGVGETRIRIDAQVFDWVIVDEAARCTAGELAVPVQMARRVLLVGDHLQLRPMLDRALLDELQDSEANVTRAQLSMSDFERAFTSPYGKEIGERFTEQYRMDISICNMVSRCFYEQHHIKLETSPSRTSTLSFAATEVAWLSTPMVWIDTHDHIARDEVQPEGVTTYHNNAEVETVIKLLKDIASDKGLVESLSKQDDETPIGVICTYRGQKARIERAWTQHPWDSSFRRMVRIDTVDAYQGKENTIVILSLVRSNTNGAAGHVGHPNRCNVAVSRAKERLVIVGDSNMWGNKVPEGSPMRTVLEHMRGDPKNATFIETRALA